MTAAVPSMSEPNQSPSFGRRSVAFSTAISTHLDTILRSSTFKSAESLRELLRFTVRETLAGRGGRAQRVRAWRRRSSQRGLIRSQSGRHRSRPDAQASRAARAVLRDGWPARRVSNRHSKRALRAGVSPHGTTWLRVCVAGGGARCSRSAGNTSWRTCERRSSGRPPARARSCVSPASQESARPPSSKRFCRTFAHSGLTCYVGRGRCSERLAGSETYLPLLEALEDLLRDGGEPIGTLMTEVAPTLVRAGCPASDDRDVDTSDRRERRARLTGAAETGTRRIHRRGLSQPSRRVLSWTTCTGPMPPTVDMLAYWASRCRSQRVLIVARTGPPSCCAPATRSSGSSLNSRATASATKR